MEGGKESVSRGSGGVVTSERHAATWGSAFFWGVFFLVLGGARTALGRGLERVLDERGKLNNFVYFKLKS